MVSVRTVAHLRDVMNKLVPSSGGVSVGLVPTMGALHAGHRSLIEQAVSDNDVVVVSIFVNPVQFASDEDLGKYPRSLEADLQLCDQLGVDVVFAPTVGQMYFHDEVTLVPPSVGFILEGFVRDYHFAGVLRVVLKLLNLVSPDRAYFGQKDAQQLLLVRRMARDFFLDVDIVPMPVIRDVDGLAFSSRNVKLSPAERELSAVIPRCISHIESRICDDLVFDVDVLKGEASAMLSGVDVDYLEFVDENLRYVSEARRCVLVLAVTVGNTRLLDSLWIGI